MGFGGGLTPPGLHWLDEGKSLPRHPWQDQRTARRRRARRNQGRGSQTRPESQRIQRCKQLRLRGAVNGGPIGRGLSAGLEVPLR